MPVPFLAILLGSLLGGAAILTQIGKPWSVVQGKRYAITARISPPAPAAQVQLIMPYVNLLSGVGIKGIQTTQLYTEVILEGTSPVTRTIERTPYVIPLGVATYSLTVMNVQELQ